MNMTWREMAIKIGKMTDEQQDTTVAILDTRQGKDGECYGIAGIGFCKDGDKTDGVLEDGDPYIIMPQIDTEED